MARTLVGGSGWLLPAPVSPMWAIARVPLSNPDAALELSWLMLMRPQDFRLSRQPTGVLRRRSGSASESCGVRAVSAARAARRAALKPYRKFAQNELHEPVLSRLMLDTWASFDA